MEIPCRHTRLLSEHVESMGRGRVESVIKSRRRRRRVERTSTSVTLVVLSVSLIPCSIYLYLLVESSCVAFLPAWKHGSKFKGTMITCIKIITVTEQRWCRCHSSEKILLFVAMTCNAIDNRSVSLGHTCMYVQSKTLIYALAHSWPTAVHRVPAHGIAVYVQAVYHVHLCGY